MANIPSNIDLDLGAAGACYSACGKKFLLRLQPSGRVICRPVAVPLVDLALEAIRESLMSSFIHSTKEGQLTESNENTSVSTSLKLPPSLSQQFFNFLVRTRDTMRTSDAFNRFIVEVFKNPCTMPLWKIHIVEDTRYLVSITTETLLVLFNRQKIIDLAITKKEFDISPEPIWEVISCLPHLKYLELRQLPGVLKCPNLESLNIYGPQLSQDSNNKKTNLLADYLKHVFQNLNILKIYDLTTDEFDLMKLKSSRLEFLRLGVQECDDQSKFQLISDISQYKQLRTLTVDFSGNYTNSEKLLMKVKESMRHLNDLQIHGKIQMDRKGHNHYISQYFDRKTGEFVSEYQSFPFECNCKTFSYRF